MRPAPRTDAYGCGFLFCALLLGALHPGPVRATPAVQIHRAEIMSTVIEAHLTGDERGRAAAAAVFAIFRDVDARMSEWKASSPLARVNTEAGGDAVPVPADLLRVVSRGVEIGELTDGAFDISWAALWGVWNFRAEPSEATVPPAARVAERAALVDYHGVVVDEKAGTVALTRKHMKLGLGGIAKGWALDRSAAELHRRGIRNFLLKAGGQIYAGGTNDGESWRVGVRDPRGAPDDFFALSR